MASGGEDNPIERIEAIEAPTQKEKKKRNPPMVAKMATLIDRMDRQSQQTEQLLTMIGDHHRTPDWVLSTEKVVETSILESPGYGGRRNK